MSNPKCVECSKPLRKYTYSAEVETGSPHPTVMYNKRVVEVVRVKILTYKTNATRLSLWCGEWGDYGDDRFCGLRCGHKWAVKHAPKAVGA
jgi:hypothetical protein